ncbi:5' nucleotidase, NT5C type [Zunongwangia atlantica]|uniref:5'(3')-deoxyribonucleotidase n=1 Tax=Zunongwangia atlantica 22II14-10F7 TaxID=1185767 RepID=A0A1Y1T5X2_9FLAO|nr:5'(3')-deoxyribonucleotidase [Zunongwangia atlantica]ORL46440.1 5'(3')-deoxyribonucleotidase [Zunongwangia atlantica 22II14-10F7]
MKKESIAIDMDGVMADVETHFLNRFNKEYQDTLTYEDLKGKSESKAFPVKGIIKKYANTPGFFETVPVMDGAIEAIKKLQERYDVYVVSAAMEFPSSLIEKRNWLQLHFPFIDWRNIVLCGNKHIINTNYMIDDHPKNLDPFKGETLLFEAFHNVRVKNHSRAKNWGDVLAFFDISTE